MPYPNRALITAPVARDLFEEFRRPVVRIPGGTNGVLQLWDTLDEDFFVERADPALTIYPDLPSIPLAIRKYAVQFKCYDSALAANAPVLKRWVDCTALDFIKVKNGGVPAVKAVTLLVAGDRPQEFELMHQWSGNVADTLGAPS